MMMTRAFIITFFGWVVIFALAACTVIVLESDKNQTATIIIDQGTGSVEPVIIRPNPIPIPFRK